MEEAFFDLKNSVSLIREVCLITRLFSRDSQSEYTDFCTSQSVRNVSDQITTFFLGCQPLLLVGENLHQS